MTGHIPTSPEYRQLALVHLNLRLQPLQRALALAVVEQKRLNAELARPDLKPLCVSEAQVDQLLDRIEHSAPGRWFSTEATGLSDSEQVQEDRLRDQAAQHGIRLPLDVVRDTFALSQAELDTLLLCAACELDRAYARVFAFVQDDLNRQLPTLDLLCGLTSTSQADWFKRRRMLGPHGTLRRFKILLEEHQQSTELRKGLRIAPAALDALGDPSLTWVDLFCDPSLVPTDPSIMPESFAEGAQLRRLAQMHHTGTVNLIGVWGEIGAPVEDAVKALCAAAGRPLRRWQSDDDLQNTIGLVATTGSVLWVDTDRLFEVGQPELAEPLISVLEQTAFPVILSGYYPWRPTQLLSARDYAEITLAPPDEQTSLRQWQQYLPGLDADEATELALRYRMSLGEQKAVAQVTGLYADLHGEEVAVGSPLRDVCRLVAQKKASRFAKPVVPRRGRDDLILPDHILGQVLEIPRFYSALGKVNEAWGFGRMATGGGGLKALFTGASGTGKTLAAEVIAAELDLPLLKIDLAQLVSKWVGETEKNIEAAFREAETCHAIVLFDEADTLFGKRGEIQQGSDRYANLEVGFLLQRLEQFAGLAVLASNLRDEIDEAFIRRFHVLLHFPRPEVNERLRLWHKAFPPNAPLHPGVDLDALADVDLTGAGIIGVGHTAALLAADSNSEWIRSEHVATAIERQFHREARVLGPNDLAGFNTYPKRATVTPVTANMAWAADSMMR